MPDVPIHAAIAHVPLGVAMVLPLLAVAITVAVRRDRLPPRAFALVALLQLVVIVTGIAGLRTGEDEEERIESVVPETAIEAHEEAAQLFVFVSVLGLVASLAAAFGRERGVRSTGAIAACAVTLAAAGLGVRAGHRGGELVYEHGAASARSAPASGRAEHED